MNEYERLKEMGYTEEEIKVMADELSRIVLSTDPMGPGRDDRRTDVEDSKGNGMRSSSIFLGYNKEGIQLDNGVYVSFDELGEAILEAVQVDGDDTVCVCKRTGARVEPPEMLDEVFKAAIAKASSIKLSEDSKITNQDSATISVREPGKADAISRGILMLGNKGIQLPNGEYVHLDEITKAIQDYVVMHKPEEEIPPIVPPIFIPDDDDKDKGKGEGEGDEPTRITPEDPDKDETFRVVKREKMKWSIIPIIVVVVSTILAMIGNQTTITTQDIVQKFIESPTAVTQVVEEYDYETPEEVAERVLSDTIGESVYVDEGIEYHESSDYDSGGANRTGTFGEGIRESGEYDLEGVSVIHDGEIVEVSFEEGETIYEAVERAAQELGVSVEDLTIRVHIGGPVSGWVDFDDLVANDVWEPQVTSVSLTDGETYRDTLEGEIGDTISITKDDGTVVEIPTRDTDGNLLDAGTMVVGSDGETYRIDELSQVEEERVVGQDVQTSKHWTFGFNNISKEEALAIAGLGAMSLLLFGPRKRREMIDLTQGQIDDLVESAADRLGLQGDQKDKFMHEADESLKDHDVTVEDIEEDRLDIDGNKGKGGK